MPNAHNANVIRDKFVKYAMAPEHPDNRRKWEAYAELGYDVSNRREEAADDVIRQIEAQLPTASAVPTGGTEWGRTYTADFTIRGPNGGSGKLVTQWMVRHGEENPRLVTMWLKTQRKGTQ